MTASMPVFLRLDFVKQYLVPKMETSPDAWEETLRWVTTEDEEPPATPFGLLDAPATIIRKPWEGRSKDNTEGVLTTTTLITIMFTDDECTNSYTVPAAVCVDPSAGFAVPLSPVVEPAPITPGMETRGSQRDAPTLEMKIDPAKELLVLTQVKVEDQIRRLRQGQNFDQLSDQRKMNDWGGAVMALFSADDQRLIGIEKDSDKTWSGWWRALRTRYDQDDTRKQLNHLRTLRPSKGSSFRAHGTRLTSLFLALKCQTGAWADAFASRSADEVEALLKEFGDLLFDTLNPELAVIMSLERRRTLAALKSLDDLQELMTRLTQASELIGGNTKPVLSILLGGADHTDTAGDTDCTLVIPKVRAAGAPPRACEICAGIGKPNQMHWHSECPNKKKKTAGGDATTLVTPTGKGRVLPKPPTGDGGGGKKTSCFRCGSPHHRVGDCPKPAPTWDGDDSE